MRRRFRGEPEHALDLLRKLGRVGGFEDDGGGAVERVGLGVVQEAAPADGAMGFEEQVIFIPSLLEGGAVASSETELEKRSRRMASRLGGRWRAPDSSMCPRTRQRGGQVAGWPTFMALERQLRDGSILA